MTFSSSETGALRWEMPTTSTLMPTPRSGRAALRCSWKDRICSSFGQVDLAHVDAVRHLQQRRGEVQDAGDAGGDEAVADVLRGVGGGGDDADRGAVPRARRRRARRAGARRCSPTCSPTRAGSVSNSPTTRKPRSSKPPYPARACPRLPTPTSTTAQRCAEPERGADVQDELGDVVADAAGAVGAEVRQVLAQLGRADARGGGERLARHGGGPRSASACSARR